jgi:hypothetical protein
VRKLIKFFKSFIEHLKVTKKTALKDRNFLWPPIKFSESIKVKFFTKVTLILGYNDVDILLKSMVSDLLQFDVFEVTFLSEEGTAEENWISFFIFSLSLFFYWCLLRENHNGNLLRIGSNGGNFYGCIFLLSWVCATITKFIAFWKEEEKFFWWGLS